MSARFWLVLAALNGFVAVAFGAFAAHGLEGLARPAGLVDKASRYQMYHALALFAVAWLATSRPSRLVDIAGWAFILGIVVFCGALYLIALAGLRLGLAAPFGGFAFLVGWALLAAAALRRDRPA